MVRLAALVTIFFAVGCDVQALSLRKPDGDLLSPLSKVLPWTAASSRHPPAEPFCTFGPRPGLNDTVRVLISGGNVRSLAFASDGDGAQSRLRCRGRITRECQDARAAADGRPPRCEDLPSCSCAPDVATLRFEVHQAMMDEVVPGCAGNGTGSGYRALLIGLGGAVLPQYVLARCGGDTRFESVEYDPRVIEAAEGFFGLRLSPGKNEVEQGDGGRAVRDRVKRGEQYDVVMVDAFEPGGTVPASVSDEAFARNVLSILKPGGKLVQHVLSTELEGDPLLKGYQRVFGERAARETWSTDYGGGGGVSRVIVATRALVRNATADPQK